MLCSMIQNMIVNHRINLQFEKLAISVSEYQSSMVSGGSDPYYRSGVGNIRPAGRTADQFEPAPDDPDQKKIKNKKYLILLILF